MSENTGANNKKQAIKDLLEKGKQKGVLTEKEIEEALSELELDADQIEKIHETLDSFGVDVIGDLDSELAKIDETETPDDPEDLSVPEGISVDDHVRMYLKEIGKVPLLTYPGLFSTASSP